MKKSITQEQVKIWVKAAENCLGIAPFSSHYPVELNSDQYTAFEHALILGCAAAELGCAVSEVKSDQLPPIVSMCFMSFRPLRSVFCTGDEEKVRLRNNNSR